MQDFSVGVTLRVGEEVISRSNSGQADVDISAVADAALRAVMADIEALANAPRPSEETSVRDYAVDVVVQIADQTFSRQVCASTTGWVWRAVEGAAGVLAFYAFGWLDSIQVESADQA